MYCEYWNLHKAPFDNVPDPSMYVDSHISMESVISETIFTIKEANEAFAVIIGAAGSGKTLSLRMICNALEPEKYKVAIITNPGISFAELLKEIISQISGKPCDECRKTVLLEMFNRLLFAANDRGQKTVILIDEANALSTANLENLRLLTNMQDNERNLFTLVLAGQMDLAQRLEHPKRSNLFQRISTYCRIDKLTSEEAVKAYIETRLKLAGANGNFFSDDCLPIIWEHSEQGVPRLINKICKLCLKTAETYGFDYISSNTAIEVCERFQKVSETAIQKRKPRYRPDDLEVSDNNTEENELKEALLTEAIPDHDARTETIGLMTDEPEPPETIPALKILASEDAGIESASETSGIAEAEPQDQNLLEISDKKSAGEAIDKDLHGAHPPEPEEISFTDEAPAFQTAVDDLGKETSLPAASVVTEPLLQDSVLAESSLDEKSPNEVIELTSQTEPIPKTSESLCAPEIPVPEVIMDESVLETTQPITLITDQSESEAMPPAETVSDAEIPGNDSAVSTIVSSEVNLAQDHSEDEKDQKPTDEDYDEVVIGEYKIQLTIPKDILMQVKLFNRESANKSAGFWAAKIVKNNPQLTSSPLADPVFIWNEIKDTILKKIAL